MDSGRDFGDSFGYDAFKRTCMSHTVLEVLASKWVYLVVCALRTATLRHGELARKIEGITPKMLTQTLRELERDGLVTAQDLSGDPAEGRIRADRTRPQPGGAARSDQDMVGAECAAHPRGARQGTNDVGEMAEFQS